MFTGLIEATGEIISINLSAEGARVKFSSQLLDFSDVKTGDSIAVNGVCLTVVDLIADQFSVDISPETLHRSCFAHYASKQRLNLEKAMLPTTRLGGHLVSGHVDGIGQVKKINRQGNVWQFFIEAPEALQRYIAEKGSICVDGISLTVNEVKDLGFYLTIIPHTMALTIMADYKVGTRVNLEVDIIARYLERLISSQVINQESNEINQRVKINAEFLEHSGFKLK